MNRRSLMVGTMTLLLASGLGGSLVARAADTPEGAVTAVLDVFMAKDFAAIGPLVCEERRDEIAAQFDVGASLAGSGIDPQLVLDGMTLEFTDPQVTLVSQDAETALVHLNAVMSITIAIDEATMRSLVVGMLEGLGMEATEEAIAQYLPLLLSMLNQSLTEPVDVDISVVNQNGDWLMCDTIEPDAVGASPSPMPSIAPIVVPGESPAM